MEEKNEAVQAVEVEAAAKNEQDAASYTHDFKVPFSYQGASYAKLTFDWGVLTGADHLAIEDELMRRGRTLVTPEFSGDFLCAMAVRACTQRTDEGFRVVTADFLKALPLRDFQTICKRARAFLMRAGL